MVNIVLAIRAIASRAVHTSWEALTIELETFGVLAVAISTLLLPRELSSMKHFPNRFHLLWPIFHYMRFIGIAVLLWLLFGILAHFFTWALVFVKMVLVTSIMRHSLMLLHEISSLPFILHLSEQLISKILNLAMCW
jgi:hypothetical protein